MTMSGECRTKSQYKDW